MTDAILAIDLGTTAVKAGLLTLDGRLLGLARHALGIEHPRPGWAEQSPDAWWSSVVAAVRASLRDGAASVAGTSDPAGSVSVVAIAVVGQGPTTVVVDGAGIALRPAITWMDRRAAAELRDLESSLGESSWGLGSLPHQRWLMRHEPSIAAAARWYLSPSDWLVLRLTGQALMSIQPGAADRTRALAARSGGDPTRFPPAVPSGTLAGELLEATARELGIDAGARVVVGGNDALASFFGAGMHKPGDAIDTGGTSGGFAVYWDSSIDVEGAYGTPAALPGIWLYGGAMTATGKSLGWLAGILGGTGDIGGLLSESATTPPGADGLVFLPYLAGERSPIWDPEARGAFAGLTLAHGRGHLVRAVLEGAALALRHVAAPILAAGIRVDAMCVSGGTARSHEWNRIKADVTRFPVAVPEVTETALMGAALLAATGAGLHPDVVGAMGAMCRVAHVIEPDPALARRYEDLYGIYHELYPAVAQLTHRLGRLAP